jgi:hypothetical protein
MSDYPRPRTIVFRSASTKDICSTPSTIRAQGCQVTIRSSGMSTAGCGESGGRRDATTTWDGQSAHRPYDRGVARRLTWDTPPPRLKLSP